MELATLLGILEGLSSEDMRAGAAAIDAHLATAAGEIDWWQATIGIDRAVRRTGRSRQGAAAAHAASSAVFLAARRHGASRSDPDVALLARTAADVGRGLVAGEDGAACAARLLQWWGPVVALRAGNGTHDAHL
jgi:hypothetical protein